MTLNDAVLRIRNRQRIKPSRNNAPAAVWTSVDHYNGEQVDTLTMIFKTFGCWWGKVGGCTMCGFVYDRASTPPSAEDLEEQMTRALERSDKLDHFMVKIFTSGSFLDENEITPDLRTSLLQRLARDDRIFKVIVETRPEFVTPEAMEQCRNALGSTSFEIAIGLETSSDLIRKRSINKGTSFQKFIDAVRITHDSGSTIKAYLLLKPLFLSEKEAMDDILKTIDDIAGYVNTISINLCNVQKGTYVEHLWERKQYRPPWLWSIVEILKEAKHRHPNLVITSDPVGAGSLRGPHNCRECSRDVVDAIRNFSLTQDTANLNIPYCECIELWKKVLELDDLTYGCPIME